MVLSDVFYSNRERFRTGKWFWHACTPVNLSANCVYPCVWSSWFPAWSGTWAVRGAVVHICSSFLGKNQQCQQLSFHLGGCWLNPREAGYSRAVNGGHALLE